MKVGDVLCAKKTEQYGEITYLTEGQSYKIIKMTKDWFWIMNERSKPNCYVIYDSDDLNLSRTYKKWFYTIKEMRELKLKRILNDR